MIATTSMAKDAKKNGLHVESKLNTFLLSLATAGIIGCSAFLWNVNRQLATLEERIINNNKVNDELMIKINNLQLDVRDIRERLVKLETLKSKR